MMVQTGIGTYAYQREDGVWGVPIGCLKDKKSPAALEERACR